MHSYRLVVNLKLGLIVAAMVIAVASLVYTNHFRNQVQEREEDAIQLWASAIQYQFEASQQQINPYIEQFRALEQLLRRPELDPIIREGGGNREVMIRALAWARGMPPSGALDFIANEITIPVHDPNRFGVPAILVDSDSVNGSIKSFRNVGLDSLQSRQDTVRIHRMAEAMKAAGKAIPITLSGDFQGTRFTLSQVLYYGESDLVKQLKIFPVVQLFFVGMFILVGYFGFSYVRRHEQSNLWVGMAKEAAHQLGTPITSMMGWIELLRAEESEQIHRMANELDKDVMRLQRVANRFSKIGSAPKLTPTPLQPVVQSVADYIRRRIPQKGRAVQLRIDVAPDIEVPLNAELFEWVIENLLKNALDAIEGESGEITLTAHRLKDKIALDIHDNGKGIEKREWKNVFRPGYSTKKRGWGLGLSLAKRIVEDYHGGTLLLLHSKLGEGTTFRMTLTEIAKA